MAQSLSNLHGSRQQLSLVQQKILHAAWGIDGHQILFMTDTYIITWLSIHWILFVHDLPLSVYLQVFWLPSEYFPSTFWVLSE